MTGLAAAVCANTMAVIGDFSLGARLGDRVVVELDLRQATPSAPARSRELFKLDPAALTPDERRWLRQAVLFVLEAQDASLRAERLRALTGVSDA